MGRWWWWSSLPSSRSISSLPRLSSILIVTLSVIILLANPTAAFYCPFDDETCFDGLAQTSVPVDFQPLFPLPLGFYYGFDAQQQGDGGAVTLGKASSASSIKLSYWLQYDRQKVGTETIQANRTTEIALRVGGLTGHVGGGNNGCDKVWGLECSSNLKSFLQHSIYGLSVWGITYESPLKAVLDKLASKYSPPTVPGCPPSFFAVDGMPVHAFVQENALNESIDVAHPGNSSGPWKTLYVQNQTALQQASQVVVGILSRGPTYGSSPLQSANDVQIELVCARAPKGDWASPSAPTKHYDHEHVKMSDEDDDYEEPADEHQVEYYARMVQEASREDLYDNENDGGNDDDDDCYPPDGELDDHFMT